MANSIGDIFKKIQDFAEFAVSNQDSNEVKNTQKAKKTYDLYKTPHAEDSLKQSQRELLAKFENTNVNNAGENKAAEKSTDSGMTTEMTTKLPAETAEDKSTNKPESTETQESSEPFDYSNWALNNQGYFYNRPFIAGSQPGGAGFDNPFKQDIYDEVRSGDVNNFSDETKSFLSQYGVGDFKTENASDKYTDRNSQEYQKLNAALEAGQQATDDDPDFFSNRVTDYMNDPNNEDAAAWKASNDISDFDFTRDFYKLQTDPNAVDVWKGLYTDDQLMDGYVNQLGEQVDPNGDGVISDQEAAAFWQWTMDNLTFDPFSALIDQSGYVNGSQGSNVYNYDALNATYYAAINELADLIEAKEITANDLMSDPTGLAEALPILGTTSGEAIITSDDVGKIASRDSEGMKDLAQRLVTIQLADAATNNTGIKLDDIRDYNNSNGVTNYVVGDRNAGLAYDTNGLVYEYQPDYIDYSDTYATDYLAGNTDMMNDYIGQQYMQYDPDSQSLYTSNGKKVSVQNALDQINNDKIWRELWSSYPSTLAY